MGSPVSQVAPSTQPQGKGFQSVAQPGQPNDMPDFQQSSAPPGYSTQGKGQMPQQGQGGGIIGNAQQQMAQGQGMQPRFGQPNMYPNTVGQWDNAAIGTQQYQAPQQTQAQPAGKSGGKAGMLRGLKSR